MDIILERNKLIDWISNVNDPSIIEQISEIKDKPKFNFRKEFDKGISGEELKAKTTEFLKKLQWDKEK